MASGNVKKFELKLGRTGILITIAGMVFLICVSFILGVTIGKNIDTYPAKVSSMPQQVLAFFWRPAKVAVGQSQDGARVTVPDKKTVDLTFHQNLTQSKTPSIQPEADKKQPPDTVADAEVPAAVAPRAEASSQKAQPEKENKPASPKTAEEKKVAEVKTHKTEAATAASEKGKGFLIHVASLKDKNKAEQITKSISELGYKSKIVKVEIKEKGVWYRIIVPGFDTRAQAKAAVDKISRKVKTNCLIKLAASDADKAQ